MTGLLVSVRNVAEAEAALLGGADLIDVKEPHLGSLGAARLDTIWEVYEFVAGQVPVSAACGELRHGSSVSPADLPPLAFAKIGLAGCQRIPDWPERLLAFWRQLPPAVAGVAVAYADWQQCEAISPDEVLQFCGTQSGCYMLVDTTDKSKSLMSWVDDEQVDRWQQVASAIGVRVVVAGSLQESDFSRILPLWQPAYVGVRGAACRAERTSEISRQRVASLRQRLSELTDPLTDHPRTNLDARRFRSGEKHAAPPEIS